ncbi:nucleoside hydrolase, partial [Acinetobacter pecorum]|uniref:nucleoside hydrolase n=1 Tax=Acinetobacter pecorum TaxID=2762215 RepID=UPI003EE43E0B
MITNKILVDTDCGPDDFLALAYLFAKPEVEVVGISIVHGMSDFEYALKNIKNFLALIDRLQVPIFMGFEASETPNCSFPLSWKEQSNQLKGVALSNSMHDFSLYPLSSIQYLEFTDLLAIGPLTNINYLNKHNLICPMTRIYIMGGAFEVKGNLFTTSNFVSPNDKAEWNIFADSVSAKELMATIKNKTYIVPLDVTNQVPINYTFFENFKNLKSSKELHRFATQIFENSTNFIQSGEFFAWDPLAALSITVPELLEFTKVRVDVDTDLDLGKT